MEMRGKKNAGGAFLRRVVSLLFVLAACGTAEAEDMFRFSIGLMPGGIHAVPSADGFKASKVSSSYYSSLDRETVRGTAVLAPLVFIGLDIDTTYSGVGFDVFNGRIISPAVMGSMSGVNISYILPHKEDGIIRFRVKYGIIQSSLNWQGTYTKVDFKDAWGTQLGVGMDLGRSVAFYWEALYRSLAFKATPGDGATTLSGETLDFSGPVVNLGVKFNF